MIEEMSLLHEHQGVAAVQMRDVGVNDDRDEARTRKRVTAQSPKTRPRNRLKMLKIFYINNSEVSKIIMLAI